ncbi:unnamed protein product [Phytophthora fragariaefolia]|uniref:Unnamed protein product n=1 Tax=Phytophthora fragariaefolia TaxID=1490495 RepID=A0A9W6X6G9_9STRA|nr:unnamed protein product [Phytophthora fragariaefolia]
MDQVAEFTQLGTDPSRVPLPKTPETKRPAKGERFRSTVGTPYFEDSHMLTLKKGKPRGGRYGHFYDASDEAELGDSRDDSADPRGGRVTGLHIQATSTLVRHALMDTFRWATCSVVTIHSRKHYYWQKTTDICQYGACIRTAILPTTRWQILSL